VSYERKPLEDRFREIALRHDIVALKQEFGIKDTAYWTLAAAKRHIHEATVSAKVRSYLYRPFDLRYLFYEPEIIERSRWEVMQHMLQPNLALICTRQTNPGNFTEILATNALVDKRALASFTGEARAYPLHIYEGPLSFDLRRRDSVERDSKHKKHNLNPKFLRNLAGRLQLPQSGMHDVPDGLTAEDIFHYAYAVFHSPGYRDRYAEFLRSDFPRLPLTGKLGLFRELARLGGKLTGLHLMESARLAEPITQFIGGRNPKIEKVLWSRNTVWLDKPQTAGFYGVPESVWNCHIGGYQVCEKWLKDRKGRTLTKDDIAHYQKIVVALQETIRLMEEIDEVIGKHGGWPGAFQTGDTTAAGAEMIPWRPRTVQPKPEDRYVTCVPLVPLKAAAGGFSDPQRADDEAWEWVVADTQRRLRRGMFVAQVVGKSMEPAIPDASWCLFASPVTGTRNGKTVLVQLRDAIDPETGERYTVKRYESETEAVDGSWRHAKITLKPVNPAFEPIELTGADEGQLQVIAELLEVLGQPSSEAEVETEPVGTENPDADSEIVRQQSFLDTVADESSERSTQRSQQRPDHGQFERDEIICIIRHVFSDGQSRDRDVAIRELAKELGYQRAGSRIRETLDNAIRTAVRRGVLANVGDSLSIGTRRIEDYDRDFLKDQFLASLEGRAWKEREDAIRDFARWLGFRRTGPVIDDTSRSIINGLIRESRLESDGKSSIRRIG